MLRTKKIRSNIWITSILILMLMAGCEESNSPKASGQKGRVIGSVHGILTDANTNARLAGIMVTTIVDGETQSVTSDSLGYYALTELSSGIFELTFSADTMYAVSRSTVYIPLIHEIVGTPEWPDEDFQSDFYHSETADKDLYALNAAVTGTVYTVEDGENTTLASEVTLIADFSAYDISPALYSVMSNNQGVFSFTELPATPSVLIRSLPFNDGTYGYNVQTAAVSLIPDGTANAGNMLLGIASDGPFIVQNNFENDDFGITEDLSITFSKAMQPSSFQISLTGPSGNVEFESSWTNDISLTISPYVSALLANSSYNLVLSGYSLDNNFYSGNYSFATQDGIEFVNTNLEFVDGVFSEFVVSDNIELTFTMEIDLDNYNGFATLTDASSALVSTVVSLSADSKTLIVNPVYDLEPDQNYTLNYRVYSTIVGDFDSGSFGFATAGGVTLPGQVSGFAINMGNNWQADWNTTLITFQWETEPNASGYSIYANDNADNTDFIRVGSFSAQDFVTNQSGTINLNAYQQFDFFDDDGIQTPFSGGTDLMFKIAANNDAGEGSFSSAILIGDDAAPTGFLNQTGTALNNSNTDTHTFTVSFTANEYLDPDVPTYGIIESGGNALYVLPSSAVSFEWDSNMRGGLFTVVVPVASNGTGDTFYVDGFMDNSGNTVDVNISTVLF
ncbi:hypothetical protein HQ531_07670 [bacterium]|nr:hypothetical protein [bacterium]